MDVAAITTPTSTPTDHPGRWIGGVLGVIASLAVAGAAAGLGFGLGVDLAPLGAEFLVLVGLLGAPIGWVLGRAALPLAREGSWGQAVAVGFGLAFVAPPLGGIAWLLFALVEDTLGPTDCGSTPVSALLLLPFIVPWSYLALIATIPAGLLWGALARLVPEPTLREARMPPLLTRLGTRHLIGVMTLVVAIVIGVGWLTEPGCFGTAVR